MTAKTHEATFYVQIKRKAYTQWRNGKPVSASAVKMNVIRRTKRPASDFPDPEVWSFHESWGLSLEEFVAFCNQGIDDAVILQWGDPFPGCREALERLRAAGHSIHIVTDRRAGSPGSAQMATAHWLHEHHLPYDTLTFASDKTIVRLDAMIEDKLENYDALCQAGVSAILMDRPWNQTALHSPYRHRVSSMGEFADLLLLPELELENV